MSFGINGQALSAAEFYGPVLIDGGSEYDVVRISDETYTEYGAVLKNVEEADVPSAP